MTLLCWLLYGVGAWRIRCKLFLQEVCAKIAMKQVLEL